MTIITGREPMLSRLAKERRRKRYEPSDCYPVKNTKNLKMPDTWLPMAMRAWLEGNGVHVFTALELEAMNLPYWCEMAHCEHMVLEPVIYCYVLNFGEWRVEPCYRIVVDCHNEECWLPF